MAVIALGLSGRERAREALVELQEDTDPAIEEFSRRIDDVTRDALQTWAVVSDIGLEGYYREYEEWGVNPQLPTVVRPATNSAFNMLA